MILKFIIFNLLFYFIKLIVKNKILPKLIAFVKKKLIEFIAGTAMKYLPVA
jgi:hypothetical protein